MSQWIGSIILVIGFVVLIQLLGVTKTSRNVVRIALHSMKVIGSPRLSDEQKESKLQKNSLRLFGLFFVLAFRGILAVAMPLGILWLCERLGWLSLGTVLATTVSPIFVGVTTILMVALLYFKSDREDVSTANGASSYSQLDRTLHQIAFSTYTVQVTLGNLEDRLFSRQLAACKNKKPVFVTALPRAGTTLLLECCASSPEFAAHRYRDMPFVMIPCLWNRFSQTFQRQIESTERAHGDGMQISPDSYEALEEVVWKTFWQRHYHRDRLIPWDYEENQEFARFFDSHLRKIIFMRRHDLAASTRYVSKNNANIARTKILCRLYPDSIIIVPFREPLEHASSLLQQHLNFLQIHQGDRFASEYMEAIGHYDFGQNLRPIDFDGWYDRRKTKDAKSLAFWLEYWIASYKHLLEHDAERVNFFNYDKLCQNPQQELKNLAEIVKSNNPSGLISAASQIRQPRAKEIDFSALPTSIVEEANSIHADLKKVC